MTKERFNEIVTRLEEVGDILVSKDNGVIDIIFVDFDGYDENWEEVEHEIAEPALYEELEDFLGEALNWDFYGKGTVFNKIQVIAEYTSYNLLIDNIRLNAYGEIVIETTTHEFYIYRDEQY